MLLPPPTWKIYIRRSVPRSSNASVGVKPPSINLDDFYKRQQEFLLQKKAKVESIAKENAVVARSASPRISAKSRSMVEHLERGDFLQRMENESSRRKEAASLEFQNLSALLLPESTKMQQISGGAASG